MKTSSTFSIMFWADAARAKNGQASIYARITVNGKRATISLKQKVNPEGWDIHKNRVRGTINILLTIYAKKTILKYSSLFI